MTYLIEPRHIENNFLRDRRWQSPKVFFLVVSRCIRRQNRMRTLSNLLLLFNLREQSQQVSVIPTFTTRLNLFQSQEAVSLERDEKIQDLLQLVSQVGQVGSLASEEEREQLEALAKTATPLSESKRPAKFPLQGEHKLLYSAAPGASSGRVFGNVVGKVSQFFQDEEIFFNRVDFGPLRIALKARREVKNDSTIKVEFLQTTISIFGNTIKEGQVGGGGVWKVKFVGKVKDQKGNEKLIRIMETPSLFILEQPLD